MPAREGRAPQWYNRSLGSGLWAAPSRAGGTISGRHRPRPVATVVGRNAPARACVSSRDGRRSTGATARTACTHAATALTVSLGTNNDLDQWQRHLVRDHRSVILGANTRASGALRCMEFACRPAAVPALENPGAPAAPPSVGIAPRTCQLTLDRRAPLAGALQGAQRSPCRTVISMSDGAEITLTTALKSWVST